MPLALLAAPRRLPAHGVSTSPHPPARHRPPYSRRPLQSRGCARLVFTSVAAGGHMDHTSAASGEGSFPFLYRLVAESSSSQIDIPPRRARRTSGMSRMVYTGFTDMRPSRLRMLSTPMRARTVRRAAPGRTTSSTSSDPGGHAHARGECTGWARRCTSRRRLDPWSDYGAVSERPCKAVAETAGMAAAESDVGAMAANVWVMCWHAPDATANIALAAGLLQRKESARSRQICRR